jgi:hypothetical protein
MTAVWFAKLTTNGERGAWVRGVAISMTAVWFDKLTTNGEGGAWERGVAISMTAVWFPSGGSGQAWLTTHEDGGVRGTAPTSTG